jgi:hypothetical protein
MSGEFAVDAVVDAGSGGVFRVDQAGYGAGGGDQRAAAVAGVDGGLGFDEVAAGGAVDLDGSVQPEPLVPTKHASPSAVPSNKATADERHRTPRPPTRTRHAIA